MDPINYTISEWQCMKSKLYDNNNSLWNEIKLNVAPIIKEKDDYPLSHVLLMIHKHPDGVLTQQDFNRFIELGTNRRRASYLIKIPIIREFVKAQEELITIMFSLFKPNATQCNMIVKCFPEHKPTFESDPLNTSVIEILIEMGINFSEYQQDILSQYNIDRSSFFLHKCAGEKELEDCIKRWGWNDRMKGHIVDRRIIPTAKTITMAVINNEDPSIVQFLIDAGGVPNAHALGMSSTALMAQTVLNGNPNIKMDDVWSEIPDVVAECYLKVDMTDIYRFNWFVRGGYRFVSTRAASSNGYYHELMDNMSIELRENLFKTNSGRYVLHMLLHNLVPNSDTLSSACDSNSDELIIWCIHYNNIYPNKEDFDRYIRNNPVLNITRLEDMLEHHIMPDEETCKIVESVSNQIDPKEYTRIIDLLWDFGMPISYPIAAYLTKYGVNDLEIYGKKYGSELYYQLHKLIVSPLLHRDKWMVSLGQILMRAFCLRSNITERDIIGRLNKYSAFFDGYCLENIFVHNEDLGLKLIHKYKIIPSVGCIERCNKDNAMHLRFVLDNGVPKNGMRFLSRKIHLAY